VNVINPSVFLQVSLGGWGNVKFKYYLDDFLKPIAPDAAYKIHAKNTGSVAGYTQASRLFYVSYGATFNNKKRFKKNKDDAPPPQQTQERRHDA